jgi:hypothetical protein
MKQTSPSTRVVLDRLAKSHSRAGLQLCSSLLPTPPTLPHVPPCADLTPSSVRTLSMGGGGGWALEEDTMDLLWMGKAPTGQPGTRSKQRTPGPGHSSVSLNHLLYPIPQKPRTRDKESSKPQRSIDSSPA